MAREFLAKGPAETASTRDSQGRFVKEAGSFAKFAAPPVLERTRLHGSALAVRTLLARAEGRRGW